MKGDTNLSTEAEYSDHDEQHNPFETGWKDEFLFRNYHTTTASSMIKMVIVKDIYVPNGGSNYAPQREIRHGMHSVCTLSDCAHRGVYK